MRNSLNVPRTLNRTGDLAFTVAAPRLWNTFNQDLSNAKTLHDFKTLFIGQMSLINAFFVLWTLM